MRGGRIGRPGHRREASLSRDHELICPPVQDFWDAALPGG